MFPSFVGVTKSDSTTTQLGFCGGRYNNSCCHARLCWVRSGLALSLMNSTWLFSDEERIWNKFLEILPSTSELLVRPNSTGWH